MGIAKGSAGSGLKCKQIELCYQRMRDDLTRARGTSRDVAGAFGLVGDAEKREGTRVNRVRSSLKHALS
jgi:hypothetical protein